jgi:hypothetical protein
MKVLKGINFTSILAMLLFASTLVFATQIATAEESDSKKAEQEEQEEKEESDEAEELTEQREDAKKSVAQGSKVRQFHQVLDELLTEFGYDVKSNQVQGLKNLAIRKVRVSEALPKSYQNYIDLLSSEQIRQNSDIRLINCIPCRAKTSNIVDGKLKITSPETNIDQLRVAASQMGIENFMDIVLVYHTTHMVLAYQIFSVETGEMLWARAYNSETIKSRFQKLAVDYKQIAKSRNSDEYEPDYRYLVGIGGGGIANIAGDSQDNSVLSFNLRATEKFNNRRSEFGLSLSYYMTMASIASEYPVATQGEDDDDSDVFTETITATTPEPFSSATGLFAIYAHNFLGSIESYDTIRHGISAGFGAIIASGYFAGAVKTGWDIYFGRRFATTLAATYILPSQILLDGETVETTGGASADIIFSMNF